MLNKQKLLDFRSLELVTTLLPIGDHSLDERNLASGHHFLRLDTRIYI